MGQGGKEGPLFLQGGFLLPPRPLARPERPNFLAGNPPLPGISPVSLLGQCFKHALVGGNVVGKRPFAGPHVDVAQPFTRA